MDNLQQGIAALRAGKKNEARKLLAVSIKETPNNERAWLWMYNAANNDKERKICLEQILRINPQNDKATQLFKQLSGFVQEGISDPVSNPKVTVPQPANQKNPFLVGCLAMLGIIIIACIAIFAFSQNTQTDTPDKYIKDYGGNRDVYVRLLSSNDCIKLQKEFDQAAENNQRYEPGHPNYQMALGYMTASDQRMKEIGCYKSSNTPNKLIIQATQPNPSFPTNSASNPGKTCCKVCGANSQPCGDTCISLKYTCQKGAGCACK